jgi:alpha-ketoglutarate-dependent taurine dioxygenase
MQISRALEWRRIPGKPAMTRVDVSMDAAEAANWLDTVRPELMEALREFGAVYIRGLPVANVEDFARIRDALIRERTPYREKTTPRSDYGDDVFSSTDLPPAQSIRMHNENSYTLTFPGLLLFACLTAPEEGGATPVADCREVLRRVPPHVAGKMRAVGWRLSRYYSDYISTDWRTAFGTEDAGEVVRYCADNLIDHAWQPDGALRTSQVRPGVVSHPSTREQVWFNHMLFWNEWALDEDLRDALVDEFGRENLPFNTEFGDGDPLTGEDLRAVQAAYDAATVREAWQPGDVMLVDNILTAHGRDPFRGARRILVAMGDPVRLADCSPTVAPAAASR